MTDPAFEIPAQIQKAFGLEGATLIALPGDASSRRYARTQHTDHGPCLVLVDSPGTPHFDNFLRVGAHLAGLGFSAPRIFEVAEADGFALIEDFGPRTFNQYLGEGMDEAALYDLATETLAALQTLPEISAIDLPAYDLARLLEEVSRFPDWFAPGVGQPVSRAIRDEHQRLWEAALRDVARQHSTLVLRDFHIDNLLFLDDRIGAARCGLLDFQDALIGSPAYDLVSLTQDARRDISPELEARCLRRYLDLRPELDAKVFRADYSLLGAQRHTKIVGNFYRLANRDGRRNYLAHVPRVLGLMVRTIEDAGLTEIAGFYDTHIPAWRDL